MNELKKTLSDLQTDTVKVMQSLSRLLMSESESQAVIEKKIDDYLFEIESLCIKSRNVLDRFRMSGDISEEYMPDKNLADITGSIDVTHNGWLRITLNTLLPSCKYRKMVQMLINNTSKQSMIIVDPKAELFEQYSDTVRLTGAAYEQWVLPKEIVTTKFINDYYAKTGRTATRPYLHTLGKQYGLSQSEMDNIIGWDNDTGEVSIGGKKVGRPDAVVDGTSYWGDTTALDNAFSDYISRSGTTRSKTTAVSGASPNNRADNAYIMGDYAIVFNKNYANIIKKRSKDMKIISNGSMSSTILVGYDADGNITGFALPILAKGNVTTKDGKSVPFVGEADIKRLVNEAATNETKSDKSVIETPESVTKPTESVIKKADSVMETPDTESVVPYTDKEKQNWENSKDIIVYESDE